MRLAYFFSLTKNHVWLFFLAGQTLLRSILHLARSELRESRENWPHFVSLSFGCFVGWLASCLATQTDQRERESERKLEVPHPNEIILCHSLNDSDKSVDGGHLCISLVTGQLAV